MSSSPTETAHVVSQPALVGSSDTRQTASPFPAVLSSAVPSTEPLASTIATSQVLGSTDFADIQLELPVEAAVPVTDATSEAAVDSTNAMQLPPATSSAAPKSIWKMLSLRSAKPTKQASTLAESAAEDSHAQTAPVSAHTSQSSLQLPPTAEADVESQHELPRVSDKADTTSSVVEEPVSGDAPHTAISKRFSFLSSFRRTSTQTAAGTTEASMLEASLPEKDVNPLQTAAMHNQLVLESAVGSQEQAQQQAGHATKLGHMQQRGLKASEAAKSRDAAGSNIELPPVFDYAEAEYAQDLQVGFL